MSRLNQQTALSLILCLVVTSLLPFAVFAKRDRPAARGMQQDESDDVEQRGLRFHLSQAPDQPEARPPTNLAPATPLSDAETATILKRLPAIKNDASDETDFALREGSLPPPRTGKTINITFPASETAAAEAGAIGPLEVVRYSPEGDVSLAPNLSVTFSQPMVALSSQEEAATNVPVSLSPQPPGKWRWVGTRTLLFEPAGRFPMATRYSVTIASGTRSANGGALGNTRSWSFTTPPPTIKTSYPGNNNTQARDALMFVEFDQRIDPAAVLRTVRVTANQRIPVSVRLATEAEVQAAKAADVEFANHVNNANKGNWLAFKAVDLRGNAALPLAVRIIVSINPGTASAEGPGKTIKPQTFSFRTYGGLRIKRHECERPCAPDDEWTIEFSNPLDQTTFQESQLRIEPRVEGLETSIDDETLTISGRAKGHTTYSVTLDGGIKDKFGQVLGRNQVVTFFVDAPTPQLFSPGGTFAVLDPAGPASWSVYSTQYRALNAKLYAVTPADWPAWIDYAHTQSYDSNARKTPPGRLVYAKTLKVSGAGQEEMVETQIDLRPALKNDLGQMILVVDPEPRPRKQEPWERDTISVWVQRTQIGLSALVDRANLFAWATRLSDGTPLKDVQLMVQPYGFAGTSGVDGTARISLAELLSPRINLLVARLGDDVAILPENTNNSSTGRWLKREADDTLRWFVFDDRKIYRPGEEVHIKGWIRRIGGEQKGDVGLPGDQKYVTDLVYTLKDGLGNQLIKAGTRVNALGGFDLVLKLPTTMNLGSANLELLTNSNLSGSNFSHRFQVQEFRRPEFEVTAANESAGPYFVQGSADVSVSASYFAGGGLPGAPVTWRVTAMPASFTPPNRSDYTFGKWTPWWIDRHRGRYLEGNGKTESFTSQTDAAGKHRLRIDFDSLNPPQPTSVLAQASVTDLNRQTWSATTTLLVHPSSLYVGLQSDKTFVQPGEPLVVRSVVTNLDGQAIANRKVAMRAALLDWKQVKGVWKQVESNPQDCSVQSATEAVQCTFPEQAGGTYRVTATVQDDQGRKNESELTLWVAGGKQPPKTGVEEEKIELIPDRKEHKAGDTAEILVQAPFYPAEAVMTLSRTGLVKTDRFRIDAPGYTLRVPIEDAWTPNIHLQLDLVGSADRDPGSAGERGPHRGSPDGVQVSPAESGNTLLETKPATQGESVRAGALNAGRMPALPALPVKRPAFASGTINLSIPPRSRALKVMAAPRDSMLEPHGETIVNVEARDAAGRPVIDGEVAVVVVDESVLALTAYKLDDPINVFYLDRDGDTASYHSREDLILSQPAGGTVRIEKGRGGLHGAMAMISGLYQVRAKARAVGKSDVRGGLALELSPAPMATPALALEGGGEIRLREDFNALAVFAPSVRTDANGRAQVQVKLPDNLTRYRVMAVAVAGGKQFGSAESAITARLPLMARPSAPRFLNFGDRFELPIVVQNQTDSAITVDLAVRATNAQLFTGTVSTTTESTGTANTGTAGVPPAVSASARTELSNPSTLNSASTTAGGTPAVPVTALASVGKRVTVPANDRVEVRIPAAASRPGTARFQVAAVSGGWSDAAEVELPVWTPASSEAFATYGQIDQGAITQTVKAPADVFKQFGGLEIETSSTQLQQLTDAFLYLQNYPYECSEQLASRILSVAALRDVLTSFKAPGLPTAVEMQAAVDRDLKRLQSLQNTDGGFGFWTRGERSWPYLSIHVALALGRAKEKGFSVPNDMLIKSGQYLGNIDKHIPSTYSPIARRSLVAFALYVRDEAARNDAPRARRLLAEAGPAGLSLEALAWLLLVLRFDANSKTEAETIRRYLNNHAVETAGTAHFACSYNDGDYLLLNSDRRADAVILEALVRDQPKSDLIPKLVRGLLDQRTRGRWENTQENVFILLALDRYFQAFEKVSPNFVARVWLGDAYAGEQSFKGRSTDRQQVSVPMHYLAAKGSAQNLIVSKEGDGRLYYRLAMKYAPNDLDLQAADNGFTVERTYEAVDSPEDVQLAVDGNWHIKAGARVRVRLTMVASSRRYHVALIDPLPAGFEALNPALAVTESIPEDKKQTGVVEYGNRSYGVHGWWLWRPVWFDHQNLRDERAEAFTSLLWQGVYNYSYVARATTPGTFVAPPAKAEEMYHPETFGRSKTDRVVIE